VNTSGAVRAGCYRPRAWSQPRPERLSEAL